MQNSNERLKKIIETSNQEYRELKEKLKADASEAKPGDIWFIPAAVEGLSFTVDDGEEIHEYSEYVEWAVTYRHPDNSELLYLVLHDINGYPLPGNTDVPLGAGCLLRCNAGLWMFSWQLAKIGKRVRYLNTEHLNAAMGTLGCMVRGTLPDRNDRDYNESHEEYAEREAQCEAIAAQLEAVCWALNASKGSKLN